MKQERGHDDATTRALLADVSEALKPIVPIFDVIDRLKLVFDALDGKAAAAR